MGEDPAEWEKNLASIIEKTNRDINRLSHRYGCSNTSETATLSRAFWKRGSSIPRTQSRIKASDATCNDTSVLHCYSLNSGREESIYASKASSDRARPLSKSIEEDLVQRVERSVRYSIEREVDEKLIVTNRAVDALLKQVETLLKTMKLVDTEIGRMSRQTVSKERLLEQMNHELNRRRSNDQVWRNTIDSEVSLLKKYFLDEQNSYSNKVSSEEMRSTIKSTHASITSTVDSILKLFQSKTDQQFEDLRGKIKFLKEEIDFNHLNLAKNDMPVEEIQNHIQLEIKSKLQKQMEMEIDASKHTILKEIPKEIESYLRHELQNDTSTVQYLSEKLLAHILPTIEHKMNSVEETLKSIEISKSKYATVEEIQERISLCKDSMKIDMMSIEKDILAKVTHESIKLCNDNCANYISSLNIDRIAEASISQEKWLKELEGNISQMISDSKKNEKDIVTSMNMKLEEAMRKLSDKLDHSESKVHEYIDGKLFETKESFLKDFDKANKKLGAMQTICKTLSAGLEMIKSLSDRVEKIEQRTLKENKEEIFMNHVKQFVSQEIENAFLPMKSKLDDKIRSLEDKQESSNQNMMRMLEDIQSQLSSKQMAKNRLIDLPIIEVVKEAKDSLIPFPNLPTKDKSEKSNIEKPSVGILQENPNYEYVLNNMSTDNDSDTSELKKTIDHPDSSKANESLLDKSTYLKVSSKIEGNEKNEILNFNNENNSLLEAMSLPGTQDQGVSENINPECKVLESNSFERNLASESVKSNKAIDLVVSSSEHQNVSNITLNENKKEIKDNNHDNLLGTMVEVINYSNEDDLSMNDEQNDACSLDSNKDNLLEKKEHAKSNVSDENTTDKDTNPSATLITNANSKELNVNFNGVTQDKAVLSIKDKLEIDNPGNEKKISDHFSLSASIVPGCIISCDESETMPNQSLKHNPMETCADEVGDLNKVEDNVVINDKLHDNIDSHDKTDYSETQDSAVKSLDISNASSEEDSDYDSDFESDNDSDFDLP